MIQYQLNIYIYEQRINNRDCGVDSLYGSIFYILWTLYKLSNFKFR